VDIGFSKQLIEAGKSRHRGNVLDNFQDVWITAEIFNLLQVNNTVSYIGSPISPTACMQFQII
jgi:hypothetical protein